MRGGAGVFFDRVPLRAVANALLSAGNTTDVTQLRQPQVSGILPTQAGAPVFPNILPDRLPSTALVSITTMDKGLQNAYSKQANIEVERTLGGSRTISVGYQYFRGENLLMSINQNVPTCVAAGTNNGCRPVSGYMNNSQYRGAGDSNYHGLHVTYLQRPKNWSSVRVSYALSKSMNDLGEAFFSSPTDPTNVMKDWGRSDNDQRHRLVVSALRQLADDARHDDVGAHQPWLSGQHDGAVPTRPFPSTSCPASTACRERQGGHLRMDRSRRRTSTFGQVEFIPRNAGTGSDFFTVSLRVSRAFRLWVGAASRA